MNDDLVLQTPKFKITGWQSVRVSRGIERCPSDFAIMMTERYPGELQQMTAYPGEPVTVKLGNDVVVTGYIDQFNVRLDPQGHQLIVTGRGKCCDLVDSCAEWPSGQITNSNVRQIAEKMAAPYGIKVRMEPPELSPGKIIPQDNLMLTSRAWQVIEEKCRWAELLAYEGADGNLVLSRSGSKSMASGIVEGENVERAQASYSQHDRYSEYESILMTIDIFNDVSGKNGNRVASVVDTGVTRRRLMRLYIDNLPIDDTDYAKRRAQWEANRRYGRSTQISVTVDSWRDKGGNLWEPNALVDVSAPTLHTDMIVPPIKSWLIAEVTYRMDNAGTHSDLTLMLPEAFSPGPAPLLPWGDVQLPANR